MLLRSIHLLLIPAILGCPLFCGVGAGVSSGDCGAAEPTSCCSACHAAGHEQSSQSDPSLPRDQNGGGPTCQCICGGATLVDGVELDQPLASLLAGCTWVGNSPSSSLAAVACAPGADWFLLQSETAATPGRLLRCLYSSLLC